MPSTQTSAEPAAGPAGLTDTEREILAFENQWWKYAGAKDTEIRARWGIGSTRYYQILNALIDRPEALAHDPMLVRRLRRLREARRRRRAAVRATFPDEV